MTTLEAIKQKQSELEAMIKAYEEQQEEAEFPKKGECYYCITSGGIKLYRCNDSWYDHYHIARGLFGKTKKEAEFKEECLKVFAELERCGGVFRTKMNNGCEFYLRLETYQPELNVGVKRWSNRGFAPNMWFPTEETAQKALDTIGEERLLKYWFCVEV